MTTTFLSAEELRELTGVRRGKDKRTCHEMQIEWLQASGIQFYINAAKRPVVPREAVLGKKQVHVKNDNWESRANP